MPKVHETARNKLYDIAKLGGSTKLVVPRYEEKPVGFVDEKGKPKAGLQFSIKKKADRCMP